MPGAPEPEEGEAAMHDSLGNVLGPVSAALARANAQADVELNLLARIEVQPDELLEIYEPTPGSILVSGAGAPAGKAILTAAALEGMTVEDVWSVATRSAEMPVALRAALGRVAQRPPGETAIPRGASGSSLDEAPPAPPASPAPLAAGWCDSGYYTAGYGGCHSDYDFQVCLDNWWNGAYAYNGGVNYVYTNVCPANGAVVLRVDSDHGGDGVWTVAQNTVRWWSQMYIGCLFDCLDVRSDVDEASNNRFHFRFLTLG